MAGGRVKPSVTVTLTEVLFGQGANIYCMHLNLKYFNFIEEGEREHGQITWGVVSMNMSK